MIFFQILIFNVTGKIIGKYKVKTFLIFTVVSMLTLTLILVSAIETVGNNENACYDEFEISKNRSDEITGSNALQFTFYTDCITIPIKQAI